VPIPASGPWSSGAASKLGLIDYPIHCWIQRATDFESFRSGSRQSYFDEYAYESTRFTPQGDLAEKGPRREGPQKVARETLSAA